MASPAKPAPKPVVDPSAARYAALEAAAKSKPGAAAAIAKTQTTQAKASIPHGTSTTLNNFAAQPVVAHGTSTTLNNFAAQPSQKPTLPFSAWDSASPSVQANYTPVAPPSVPVKKIIQTITGGSKPGSTPAEASSGDTSGSSSSDTGGGSSSGSSGNSSSSIKVATSNLFMFNEESVPIEAMADLIFEDIGGHEIIGIARSDMTYALGGEAESNQAIKNLSDLSKQYNPQNILAVQDASNKLFAAFPINFYDYIPATTTELDTSTNNLIVNVTGIDVNNKELVEIEVLTYGNVFDATIYEG